MPDPPLNGLTRLLNALDRRLRRWDWRINRSHVNAPRRVVRAAGHARWAVILAVPVVVVLVLGPTLGWRGADAAAVVLAGLAVLWAVDRLAAERWLSWLILFIVAATAACVWWWLAAPAASERMPAAYRHVLVFLLAVLAVHVLVARLLAAWLFAGYRARLAPLLRRAELFVVPVTYPIEYRRLLRSLASVPLSHPVQLLFPPSLAVLLVFDPVWMRWSAAMLFAVAWFALAAAGVHERLQAMLELSRRVLFVGGQLVVSLAVIGLALGRWLEWHYVQFLIESGPYGINATLALYVLAAYAFFWFDEYWINRALSERVLDIFRAPADDRSRGRIDYPVKPTVISTAVLPEGRVLQIHGGARFAAQGWYLEHGRPREAFHTYRRDELVDRVLRHALPSGQALRFLPAHRRADWVRERLEYTLQAGHVKQRILFYFMALNALLAGALVAAAWVALDLPQRAELIVRAPPGQGGAVDLRERLFGAGAEDRAVLVAASGGGTRAALYAQSVYRGLQEAGALADVVLASSVSGGSAATAYLGAHRPTLLAGGDAAWQRFSDTMAAPYIQDVLEGVVEWRIAAGTGEPLEGVRLGELLAESFDARFAAPPSARTLGDQRELGLLFNTALAGEFPAAHWRVECALWRMPQGASCGPIDDPDARRRCCACESGQPLSVREAHCPELRTARPGGGRLVLTNLRTAGEFPGAGLVAAPSERLVYVVVRDPGVPLARAAALSANFPPVFSNAAVDVAAQRRYWVTDGGAVDNRGVLSLFYALRAAIRDEAGASAGGRARPELHLVVAEASATSFVYAQDRGISTKLSAPEKLASQLMVQLGGEVEREYAAIGGRVAVHYLAMPAPLRSDGSGLGTHWILPATTELRRPPWVAPRAGEPDALRLCGTSVQRIIDELHQVRRTDLRGRYGPRAPLEQVTRMIAGCGGEEEEAEIATVWRWICEDDVVGHARAWSGLLAALGASAAAAHPRCGSSAGHRE